MVCVHTCKQDTYTHKINLLKNTFKVTAETDISFGVVAGLKFILNQQPDVDEPKDQSPFLETLT